MPEQYRHLRPWAHLAPLTVLRRLPPGKLGDATLGVAGGEARGTLWISTRCTISTRHIKPVAVLGIDGTCDSSKYADDSTLVTRGEALELALFLEALPQIAREKRCKLPRLRVVIGGNSPILLSTASRLLARQVGEMVMMGTGNHMGRITQQILAETGLAVRSCISPTLRPQDLTIWCGLPPVSLKVDHVLFLEAPYRRDHPAFSWTIKDASRAYRQEMATYAGGEAFLLALAGWKKRHLRFGTKSVDWVENVGKLAKDMGLALVREELDTPKPVGYNDYNL